MDDYSILLLRRSPLFPGESLHSLLIRLALINHYDSPSTIYQIYGGIQNSNNFTFPKITDGNEIKRLSKITQLNPMDLYLSSIHRFTDTLTPPGKKTNMTQLPGGEMVSLLPHLGTTRNILRPFSAAQFCPKCLRQKTYHRLEWIPISVTACLHHRCLLLDQCPQCQRPVPVRSVVEGYCRYCGANLSQAKSIEIKNDAVGLFCQGLIRWWLEIGEKPSRPWPIKVLTGQPNVLFRLMDGIRHSLILGEPKWIRSISHKVPGENITKLLPRYLSEKMNTPSVNYILETIAIRSMSDWPRGFHALLRDYPRRLGRSRSSGILYKDYGSLFSCWLERGWRHPNFNFVQEAFNQFLCEEYGITLSVLQSRRYQKDRSFLHQFPAIHRDIAARFLGISQRHLKTLIEKGKIRQYTNGEGNHASPHFSFVMKEDVRRIQKDLEGLIDLASAEVNYCISQDTLMDLIKSGIIEASIRPEIDGTYAWKLSRSSVDKFVKSVLSCTQNIYCSEREDFIGLSKAAQVLSGLKMNISSILRCVIEGRLIGYLNGNLGCLNLGQLAFKLEDLHEFMATTISDKGLVSRGYLARRMRVKEIVATRWIKSGMLSPVVTINNANYFDEVDINYFIQTHIFTEDAAKILKLGTLVVQKWARDGRLKPVSGPQIDGGHRFLFQRGDVDRLRPENRLSVSQVANLQGRPSSVIYDLIRIGELRPFSGPGIDQSKHFLFLRDSLF